jgi:hypothetical protein
MSHQRFIPEGGRATARQAFDSFFVKPTNRRQTPVVGGSKAVLCENKAIYSWKR